MPRGYGFQRDNPRLDLRGGGILSLKCLVYFFERCDRNRDRNNCQVPCVGLPVRALR
jgi:hypothetical protein